MLKGFNMSEKDLFGSRIKYNSKYSLLQVLELLIMFPCFMIRIRKKGVAKYGFEGKELTTRALINLLSLPKRFTSYETIGGILRDLLH